MNVEKSQVCVDHYEQRLHVARDALRAARRRERSVAADERHDAAVSRKLVGLWVQFYECLAELDEA